MLSKYGENSIGVEGEVGDDIRYITATSQNGGAGDKRGFLVTSEYDVSYNYLTYEGAHKIMRVEEFTQELRYIKHRLVGGEISSYLAPSGVNINEDPNNMYFYDTTYAPLETLRKRNIRSLSFAGQVIYEEYTSTSSAGAIENDYFTGNNYIYLSETAGDKIDLDGNKLLINHDLTSEDVVGTGLTGEADVGF